MDLLGVVDPEPPGLGAQQVTPAYQQRTAGRLEAYLRQMATALADVGMGVSIRVEEG